MEYHDLEKNTVSKLREMLKEQDPERTGVSGLKKHQLVELVAEKLGVKAPHKVVTGVDKAAIKAEIRTWKAQRDVAIQARDRAKIKESRRQLHRLRRNLRKATTVVET